MAHITVTVNARKYEIACDDGQEAHLTRLSQYVDKRIQELVAAVGQIDESRLLLMTNLLLADELSDAYAEMEKVSSGRVSQAKEAQLDAELNNAMGDLAERIESIAEQVEAL
ncbi:MAG: cell division protein ZapA [Rhodospirillales bacterium]|nr:cell division protein ZapA [Rhodospirillales bacterium]